MPLLKQKPNEKDQQQKSDLKINMNSTGVDGGGTLYSGFEQNLIPKALDTNNNKMT